MKPEDLPESPVNAADDAFYRTVITVEVLSKGPVDFDDLAGLHYAITDGDCSGDFAVTSSETVSRETMAELLQAQGSDPSFLLGDDEEEEEEGDDEAQR